MRGMNLGPDLRESLGKYYPLAVAAVAVVGAAMLGCGAVTFIVVVLMTVREHAREAKAARPAAPVQDVAAP